jgi:hypothetical protein
MFESDFEKRVKVGQIIQNQLPEFILSEAPKTVDFLQQYYVSQEHQGGPSDIAENLDQYLKIDKLIPEVIEGSTSLSNNISASSGIVTVISTKGFPSEYGLLKVNDEIITYTGVTTNTFTGCIRGFSGITGYNSGISTYSDSINRQDLVFSTSSADSHDEGATVTNLSSLFLKEFYKKLKYFLTPGLEDNDFFSGLNVNNFIKESRSFYQSKGIEESFRILFNVLYGEPATVVDLENFLIKPSSSNFIRREVLITELISGNDPTKLVGQTVKKSTDPKTQGSVSEVEILTRENKSYYKVSLFVGYDDKDLIEGNFTIPGKTKVLETVAIGSSIISVDSTIGFGLTGTIISGSNIIDYTSKSVNQFFGCSGIINQIDQISDVKSNEVIYGYENGDTSKKVELRITGVISKFTPISDIKLANEQEIISIKNIGEIIKNPDSNKSSKQVFANSWIYNTSSRYQVSKIVGSTFTLLSKIDKSSLIVGDYVDIIKRGTNDIVIEAAQVSNIITSTNEVILNTFITFNPNPGLDYDIRRRIRKVSSSGATLQYGNNKLLSDILNVYSENDTYGYITSNSLPNYEITTDTFQASIDEANGSSLQEYNEITTGYSVISFPSDVPFLTGDSVFYEPSETSIQGLTAGVTYYVKVVASNQIKLYLSESILSADQNLEFYPLPPGSGSHTFILSEHRKKVIGANSLLRKFPYSQNLSDSEKDRREIGPVGVLINGVEIISPESEDKIYYGPLSKFNILNSGKNYDVINPPRIEISSPNSGTTASVLPVISGIVTSVLVDPQDFDVDDVVSITITGGNGTGCSLQPVMGQRYREVTFDSRQLLYGGGIDITYETITFTSPHLFKNGETIIYNQNGNDPIGIGTYAGSNALSETLVSGSEYIARIINPTTIQLYNNISDYNIGINTIGITTNASSGLHKFRTLSKNTLRSVKVLNSGSGYQFRKLYVKSSGISTQYDTIQFDGHGFNNGDLIEYQSTGSVISGLSTSNQYYVLKVDDNSFRLSDAGIGASITSNYQRRKYTNLVSTGSEYHIFKYPDIKVTINVSYGTTTAGDFVVTPIISGKIVDAYLYEPGSGYGSNILNLEKKPLISLKNGKNAELKALISEGKIQDVQVLSRGSEYTSPPDLEVTGSGSGAILRAVVENERLVNVVVINSGIGYEQKNTTIKVNPRGSGVIFDVNIRALTVNNQYKYSQNVLIEKNDILTYNIVGYSEDLGKINFLDNGLGHSPIIGWAYDGNPIYGPYGFSVPNDNTSPLKVLKTGYSLNFSNIFDRPSGIVDGFFLEDYVFDNSGDLDLYNGRFCKTPDFPNGVYAYFVGVNTSAVTNKLEPYYPYFIGDYYRSPIIKENFILDQSYDLNQVNLVRNTFPYKVQDPYAGNDFITESNEVIKQLSVIESVTKGVVDSLEVINGGDGYKVGEYTVFNDNGTNGNGVKAVVSELKGKQIDNINTSLQRYENSTFIWEGNDLISVYQPFYNTLNNGDYVSISGLTSSITGLTNTFKVGITSEKITLFKNIPTNVIPGGVTEDIYVSNIPNSVSIGSSLKVDNEILTVLNIFKDSTCLRVKRHVVSAGHASGSNIDILTNNFKISTKVSQFDSRLNDKVYFNGHQSVGMGTTSGLGILATYTVGETSKQISIPTRSIYLPDHPFETGQVVTLTKNPTANSFIVGVSSNTSTFNLPDPFINTISVYVINKSKDYIGLTTVVGLTTNTEGLFFFSNGDDDSQYSLESQFTQVKGSVDRIVSKITTTELHGLENGDSITFNVIPNISVGIGTTIPVVVKYNKDFSKLLINPVGFTSSQINIISDKISIPYHGFETGDKVLYSADKTAAGLETGVYFVYKIDSNNIQLSETYYDVETGSPTVVNITGIGGSQHSLASVNPKISVIRNNNLVFNLSDPSLSETKFKIYYDNNFNKEFLSTNDSSNFNVVSDGNFGVDANAQLRLNYSDTLPSKLFYSLEISGNIIPSDKEVKYGSEIVFSNSKYNGSYKIFGITTSSFNVSLASIPESLSYTQSDCKTLEYSTSSNNVYGAVKKLKILSKGSNYKKLPKFIQIKSENGTNANILPVSKTIGRIKDVRVLDIGYEYSSDKTLRPEAFVSPIISIENSDNIQKINVIDGGKYYLTPPDLILYNPVSKKVVDETSLIANVPNTTISSVTILGPIYGMDSVNHNVLAINNSNGVGISSMITGSGIVTCQLSTPFVGFSTNIFSVGDQIFVEGVEKYSEDGSGFNSSDYNYGFFTVTAFENTNPAKLEYTLAGLTTNPGIAKTFQSGYATIVNKKIYPDFEVIQQRSLFQVGEQLYSDTGSGFIERDVYITDSRIDYIKIKGTYELSTTERIKGKKSGVVASIKNIEQNIGKFEIDYSNRQDYGWIDDVGKLDEDYQVTPDNNYYQNLSYAIKSSIEYEKFIDPVNRLLHPSGLKNFANTNIDSVAQTSVSIASTTKDTIVLDVLEEKRVDAINVFDLGIDYTPKGNKSKYLKFKNKKLSAYTQCRTNRVLIIDDISPKFSSKGSQNLFTDIDQIDDTFEKYLVQIIDPDTNQTQVSEVVVLSTEKNVLTFEKETLFTSYKLGDISGQIDSFDTKTLRFVPTEVYNRDHDIKVLKTNFNTDLSGIGSFSIGSINLSGVNRVVSSASTSTIISYSKTSFESLFANIQIINNVTKETNYVELLLDYDGTDTYLAEYYFDSRSESSSQNYVGIFTATVDPVSNKISLDFYNDQTASVLIRSNIVGFGSTASGIGTYRFKVSGQKDGSERTSRLQSNFSSGNGGTGISVCDLNTTLDSTIKSLVKVSCGQTNALHQVLMTQNKSDVVVVQYPFISIGTTSGIGTFGGQLSGNTCSLKFYPDPNFSSNVKVQSYNEILYSQNDFENVPDLLPYGTEYQSLLLSTYDGINGNRANKTDFDLKFDGYPIYKKTFDPSDSDQLDLASGIFTVPNHFFNTGEQLTYTPNSTFSGIGATSVGIGSTANYAGIVTNRLPQIVYPIVINSDQFKLSTKKEYANSGIYVTFTSYGEGNAHELEMTKKLEKSVISLDGIVQQPITYTYISQNLSGSVGFAASTFSLTGISTLQPRDILRVDNEYMKVISVGFGTTSTGPITGLGTFPLVTVRRGSVGSSATTHNNGALARVYRGSFNIVGSKIYFLDAPKGNTRSTRDVTNLPYTKAEFNGRAFLRQDYATNILFDDISDQFTGIGRTYTLSVQGANTTGLTVGNGILFINGVFQTPSTTNNQGNNYSLIQNAGISSVVFTGISSENGALVQSAFDINQNQVPRGGLIVSLGSTPGLGYAPLVGASVTSVINKATGSIISVGIGTTDILGSGYRGPVSIAVTQYGGHTGNAATVTATVGAGGSLAFNVVYGGTGYTNPVIQIPDPVYENLQVVGVSRLGLGNTTDTGKNLLLTVDVGASNTTGIGSTLFQVSSFKISRPGYGFKVGDVFKPVGLVTAKGLSAPISEFQLTVIETFNDYFSSWQFGEMDHIDSIRNLQNGNRVRFPLYYNGNLLSFEKDPSSILSEKINLNAILLIFINGVLQTPGVAYQFEGGTSFTFSSAPKNSDKIDIFFYLGTRGVDVQIINAIETVKSGDKLNVYKNPSDPGTISQENKRYILEISGSDLVETDIYVGRGVDDVKYKPIGWEKQKVDTYIKGDYVYKSRDSIESLIYPTAKIIKGFDSSSPEIFVDNAQFFNYEENNYDIPISTFDGLIVAGTDPVGASLTAIVSEDGKISSIAINASGSGYNTSSVSLKIGIPTSIGIGIGTTATADAYISNGVVGLVSITNPGLGYDVNNPPQVIIETPAFGYEKITGITNVQGFSGIITGITTTTGTSGHPLALKFFFRSDSATASDLIVGYPICIVDTKVGSGVTSVDSSNTSIVGIGTSFLDNIYYVHSIFNLGPNGQIVCNVHSQSPVIGINTFGSTTKPLGRLSWGRLYNLQRSTSPISIGVSGLTVDAGLSTFPTIQRRGFGLRDTGAIRKVSNIV